MSVCHKHCFFFFVSRWNQAISWPSVLHDKKTTKLFYSTFDLGHLKPKIYSPKFACGSLNQSWVNELWARRGVQSPTGLSTCFDDFGNCNLIQVRQIKPA